jgi:hypothetical protein
VNRVAIAIDVAGSLVPAVTGVDGTLAPTRYLTSPLSLGGSP